MANLVKEKFRKISVLVNIFENLAFGEIFGKSRLW